MLTKIKITRDYTKKASVRVDKTKNRALCDYRYQELLLQAFERFNVKGKWRKICWGRVGNWLKKHGEKKTEFVIEKIVKDMNERRIYSQQFTDGLRG